MALEKSEELCSSRLISSRLPSVLAKETSLLVPREPGLALCAIEVQIGRG